MKNIIITLFIISFFSCKAQTPIIDLYGPEDYGSINNAYYKDLNNFQNQYVGTWIYSSGNILLEVVFKKKSMFPIAGISNNFYADELIGEYKYIEDGIEKVNTLSNIHIDHSNIQDYNLTSIGQIWKSTAPQCPECSQNEKRMVMKLSEPSRSHIIGLDNVFVMRRFIDNGIEKLKVWFIYEGNGIHSLNTFDGELTDIDTFSIPFGEYVLIKQ